MSGKLPIELQEALAPLFKTLPFETSMTALVVRKPVAPERAKMVGKMLEDTFWREHPALRSGLWLYVDGLEESHSISQKLLGTTGAFWHGIMHRREGDFGNAKYWFHQTEGHPALKMMPDYNPYGFVDEVQAAVESDSALIARQREEWSVLMQWCYENPGR